MKCKDLKIGSVYFVQRSKYDYGFYRVTSPNDPRSVNALEVLQVEDTDTFRKVDPRKFYGNPERVVYSRSFKWEATAANLARQVAEKEAVEAMELAKRDQRQKRYDLQKILSERIKAKFDIYVSPYGSRAGKMEISPEHLATLLDAAGA